MFSLLKKHILTSSLKESVICFSFHKIRFVIYFCSYVNTPFPFEFSLVSLFSFLLILVSFIYSILCTFCYFISIKFLTLCPFAFLKYVVVLLIFSCKIFELLAIIQVITSLLLHH